MSYRPGFSRADTDILPSSIPNHSKAQDFGGPELKEEKEKAGLDVSDTDTEAAPTYEIEDRRDSYVVYTAKDIVTSVIHVEDDPSLNPWTFRTFFLGIGLAVFASVLQEIFYFKPQVILVSVVFLTVIAYVLGEGMAFLIPRWGKVGRFLNPGPFNLKEHAAICIMASAAGQSALSTEALAVQDLYYGGYPSVAAGIFITLSSQLLGYGIAGMLRQVLVFPVKMLWPMNLPITSLLESLHRDKRETKQRLKVFYIIFFAIFVWEVIPEYIFPVLEGVSIFCLAKRNSLVFTNLFGGVQGNEGLGFLSVCFDWQYIASLGSPLWLPLYTLTNSFIGYMLCIVVFMAVYYGNIWNSQNFPFLAQLLFDGSSNSTNFVPYNQSTIIGSDFLIDNAALEQQGIPWLTGTYVTYLITTNMGTTATLVHMLLWNYDDIKKGWAWLTPSALRSLADPETWKFWKVTTNEQRRAAAEADPSIDPHYRLLLRYEDSPDWWYGLILVVAFIVGIACLYVMHSTLPWWGFIVSIILTTFFTLFFGAQYGMTGFQFNMQPICQMLAGYMFPGRPLANMYFTCFTWNTLQQAEVLSRDLKLGQFVHLSPRCTFTVQVIGCVVGSLFNFIMMLTITKNQAPILTSIEGTNIWSGQNLQFNTLAIAWSIAKDTFSIGARYQWVTIAYLIGFAVPFPFWIINKIRPNRTLAYLNTSLILWYMGWLFVGINSSILSYFLFGFVAQFWLRKYKPELFIKYNYLVSAALDGGTQVIVFILTFAIFGGNGNAVPFPNWAGNPDPASGVNLDYCMANPANG